jgi:magnesium chelatase family protein
VGQFCQLDSRTTHLLVHSARRLGLSARGYDRLRKVARTIADLDGADEIGIDHMGEALQFRMM